MSLTTRSLLLALLASFSMGLYAKSMLYSEGPKWINAMFLVASFAAGIAGIWLGIRGARQQRGIVAWLAPGLNALLILAFLALMVSFFEALKQLR